MAIEKTLGGDRIGSGKKMQISLHNYERSTHDLSYVWRSTAAPGVITPFMNIVGLNGDTFDIKLSQLIRTLPTIGPAFSSYKFQADVFMCPIRLYNAILHNNATKIGMEMSKVLFPKVKVPYFSVQEMENYGTIESAFINQSSLLAYLGYRNPGQKLVNGISFREVNAMPVLAYWDIFKNYYSNKQEENAYVIGGNYLPGKIMEFGTMYNTFGEGVPAPGETGSWEWVDMRTGLSEAVIAGAYTIPLSSNPLTITNNAGGFDGGGSEQKPGAIVFHFTTKVRLNYRENPLKETDIKITFKAATAGTEVVSLYDLIESGHAEITYGGNQYESDGDNYLRFTFKLPPTDPMWMNFIDKNGNLTIVGLQIATRIVEGASELTLESFPLKALDDARKIILKNFDLGTRVYITRANQSGDNIINFVPYNKCSEVQPDGGRPYNASPMNGLAVKTYQSDLFNNWLNTEWIEGDNGINAITRIDTSDGLELDALNLAQKVYNMLNRIAASGGTYEDWQEAAYGEDALRRAESPIYCGGMSAEIVFDEVVSTADTDTSMSGNNPLGKLAGRGRTTDTENGNIIIKCNEPCIILGLMAITPRVDYSQGNDWAMQELDNMGDLHVPALDGIGFQDLNTYLMHGGEQFGDTYRSAGKVPAWIDYMTNFNKVFGGFCYDDQEGFMVARRDYEMEKSPDQYYRIKDLTTYIDPQKYNYMFADTRLEAQNFWVQIGVDIEARRKMSAKQIPNL